MKTKIIFAMFISFVWIIGFSARSASAGPPDGHLDIVAANLYSNDRLCTNNGSASFQCKNIGNSGGGSQEVAVGDFNGDSVLDVVVADRDVNRVCLNDGFGKITCQNIGTSAYTANVAVGDVDDDDDLDIVFANIPLHGRDGHNHLCLNDGQANFSCSNLSEHKNSSTDVALGDIDDDGDLDALFTHALFHAADPLGVPDDQLCLNDGTGVFSCTYITESTEDSYSVALGDMNGNGHLDALINTRDSDHLCLNSGSGQFSCTDINGTDETGVIAIGEINGDNHLDFVIGQLVKTDKVCINDGSAASFTCTDIESRVRATSDLDLGDLNGDTFLDVVISFNGAGVQRCLNDGQGVFICANVFGSTNSWGVAVGDFGDSQAQLTVIKNVVNDNGGTAVAGDFTMNITGTNVSNSSFPGSGNGVTITLDPGSYEVTESGVAGYADTFSNGCAGSIGSGESKTCTITNNDIAPTVTLTKVVVGGTAGPNEFGLTIGGVAVNSGDTLAVTANTPIALNEAGSPIYQFGSISGDVGCPETLGGTVTLGLAEAINCTITNIGSPDLTLSKDDGAVTVQPGDTISYTLPYANVNASAALNATITDTVPAHTTFNAGASSVGWSCAHGDPAGTVCTIPLGTVSGYSGPTNLVFAVDVLTPVVAGVDQISNEAAIGDDGTNGPDSNPDDNDANDTTPLEAAPDLKLTKDDGGVIGIPDDVIVYTLSVTNNGDQGATAVTFTETVPDNTTFDAASSSAGWSCSDGDPEGTVCTLPLAGELAGGGGSSAVYFAIKVDGVFGPGVGGIVTNNASVTDDGTNGEDQNPLDNEAAAETTISDLVYVSASSNGQIIPDVPWYDDEDILLFDPRTASWTMYFDGSDVGQGNLDGFLIMADDSILMTFEQTETLPDVGEVDDTDIVRFIPTSLGNTTAGSFEWFLDGSDVGLVSANDAIVAIAGSPDGRVVISTQGNTTSLGFAVQDEDLIVFNANSFGASSSGTWEMYFDGSDVDLQEEDLQCTWIDSNNNNLFLSPDSDLHQVPNFNAERDDIFLFDPDTLGDDTTGTFASIFFDGDLHSFANENIDGCAIGIYGEISSCSAATAVAPTVSIEKVGHTAHLTWSDNPANSSGYTILRSTSPHTGYTLFQTVPAGVTEYDDVGAMGNGNLNYFYKVRGLNSCLAESADSNLVGEFDFAIIPGN